MGQFPDVVQLSSCQVFLQETTTAPSWNDDDNAGGPTDVEEELMPSNSRTTFDATVVVTVTFPRLLASTATHSRRSLVAVPTTQRRGAVKLLHPTLQVLLSIVRSDWDALHRNKQRRQVQSRIATAATRRWDLDTRRKQPPRLFPNRVSLEELYLGMQGTATDSDEDDVLTQDNDKLATNDTMNNKDTSDSLLMLHGLPRDILAEKIAPFLNAPSLDAWRCSCTFFHQTLQAVVPGLNPKLRLYRHQITSLSWMRQCETRPITESHCLSTTARNSQRDHVSCPDGDWHRAVTAGQSTLLRTRDGKFHCRLSQTTGLELTGLDEHVHNRSVARGGLLADEPGLGKTITVLSLILQTLGLTTQTADGDTATATRTERTNTESDSTEERVFNAYWKESIPVDFRRSDLISLTNRLARAIPKGLYLQFALVRVKMNKDLYATSFDDYVQDMTNEMNIAFAEDDGSVGQSLQRAFEDMVQEYKAKQLHSAGKSYAKVRSHPNSSVASLYEAHERQKFLNSLIASKGTLLVVPSVLLDHWKDQIKEHVNFVFLAKKAPLVFEYTGALDLLQNAIDRVMIEKTHTATVFIDRAPSKPLPPADFLACFHIVITSNSRLTYEWKHGSFQDELKRMGDSSDGANDLEYACFDTLNRGYAACPLLKVHWLRLVVDEGHSMGKTNQNSVRFASWISAERRWGMTGTPTKHGATAINEVLALTRYLQHDFFTARCEGDSHWKKSVAKLWKDQNLAGFFRLRSLLSLLLKRHTKLDIKELPQPLFRYSSIPMSAVEVETYNTIVSAVSSNLVLTSLKEDARQDSLLHVSNRKYAGEALANARRVCVGFSRVLPVLTDRLWQETIGLAKNFGLEENAITRVRQFMYNAENGNQSDCQCCGSSLSVLLITPCCGGFLCTDCVNTDVRKENSREVIECLLCNKMSVVDRLQRFQPGFKFEWLDNLKELKKSGHAKSNNSSMEHTLPPTAPQQNAVAAAVAGGEVPIIRPPTQRQRTKKPGDGHECIYDRYAVDGKCLLCLAEHESCNLLRTGRCNVCHRAVEECPDEESKSSYLLSRLLGLAHRRSSTEPKLKVIVYSQYRKALDVVGHRLLGRFGTACIAEYFGKYRTPELRKFRHSNECFCMLLSNDGSEGLDLSFVTHIFFLEEIWDQSRADQAVARAWRMGATGRVEVETIIAENSVEETMQKYEAQHRQSQNSNGTALSAAELSSSKEYQAAKTHALLKSLKYITEFQSFRKSTSPFDEEAKSTGHSTASHLESVNSGWKRCLSGAAVDKNSTTPLPQAKRQRRVGFSN